MLKYGLTGGIASGKSAVAAMLREMGFPVLDADALSHKLMEPGQPARDEMLQEFGADLAGGDGRIDRAKLGNNRLCRSGQAGKTKRDPASACRADHAQSSWNGNKAACAMPRLWKQRC